jgi:HD domain
MEDPMDIKREELITSLGGEAAVKRMDHEARADALEDFMSTRLDAAVAAKQNGKTYPTVAELESKVDRRGYRRGAGKLFIHERNNQNPDADDSGKKVARLQPMPEKPTLIDFFKLRFPPAAHLLQSARLARKNGLSEEIILACLLHDAGQYLCRADHGYWGAQIVEPYVSERIAFAIKYHQALRFYPDPSVNYEYPVSYYTTFGVDYEPLPHVKAAYEYARNHKWYMDARMVTTNDLYSFDPNVQVEIDEFTDIIGRNFKQPKEGLGNDNTPVTHMWRTMAIPDAPL